MRALNRYFSNPGLALALLAPAVLIYVVAFLAPVIKLAFMSFVETDPSGSMLDSHSTENYVNFITDGYYISAIANSLGMAAIVTVLTLICAYPIAMVIQDTGPRWRNLLIVITISPLLVSSVVRTYGWILLLGDTGVINYTLQAIGLTQGPLRLLNNYLGVVIGLVEILMPYMALSLLAGFGRLNADLNAAAASLGANAFRRFFHVTLPLTVPGIALGSLLCFVLAISSFVTPRLLGGGRVVLLATEIYDQAIVELQWPMAATLSITLLILLGVALALYSRMIRRFA